MNKRTLVTVALALIAFVPCLSTAKDADPVLLTVTGKVTNGKYEFKRSDLMKLPTATIHATTSYAKTTKYSGPLMRDILIAAGAAPKASRVVLVGLDGYVARAPIDDFKKWDVVAALAMDDIPMTVETKGPLWVMYPLDKHKSELSNNTTDTKLVWNLVAIRVQ